MKKLLMFAIVFICMMSVADASDITSLNVTVTGVELGNTPNHTAVTLDTKDVEVVAYSYCHQNTKGGWDEIASTDEFEGGVYYNITIYIKPKDDTVSISSLSNKDIKLNNGYVSYYYQSNYKSETTTYKIFTRIAYFEASDYAVVVTDGTAKVNGKVVERAKPGDKVTITYNRGGTLSKTEVTLTKNTER